ncbi:MAG: M18 family aminopeptidase [Acidimicrobiaceae bacterium]|nr:M18 family aminopeptidase [Acidimicrobiaceae bacterium]
MPTVDKDRASDLCRYVDASPSPFHAVAESVRRLEEVGFRGLDADDTRPDPGRWYHRSGGALVAWVDEGRSPDAPLRIIGAHTDSPNLRVKPLPDHGGLGLRQVGVEVYGGALLNSWLDRDLGVSGRLVLREGAGRSVRLVRDDRPVARIPQLAIHLDRGVTDKGLVLNAQNHLSPVMGAGLAEPGAFVGSLAVLADVDPSDVLAFDAMFHDLSPSILSGPATEFVSAPRLDDLLSCHAGTEALITAAGSTGGSSGSKPDVVLEREGTGVPVLALFDHEEVGSISATGAGGPLLVRTLRRFVGLDDRRINGALVLSVDGAHGTHPNYPDRHDGDHPVLLNGGPVLKFNAKERYATDAPGAAEVRDLAERAGVPLQSFVSRSDMPCGSTIGPSTAAETGLRTVDLGVAQLAMHSAREFCGSEDPALLGRLLDAVLAG